MRFRGYGNFGGIWESTQTWVLENLPTWASGVIPVDVSTGEAGVQELLVLAATWDGSEQLLLSARAQAAYWSILERQAGMIDDLFVETASIGGKTGEALRAMLEADKAELIGRAVELQRMNGNAFSAGVPEALAAEWYPGYTQRAGVAAGAAVLESPAFWGVLGAVVIASVILAGALTVTWGIGKYFSYQEMLVGLSALPNPEDRIAYLTQRLQTEGRGDGEFPWGWVIGVGAAGIGVMMLVAWAEGSLGRWMAKLRSGTPGSSWAREY